MCSIQILCYKEEIEKRECNSVCQLILIPEREIVLERREEEVFSFALPVAWLGKTVTFYLKTYCQTGYAHIFCLMN
jgi:hypothetical protein